MTEPTQHGKESDCDLPTPFRGTAIFILSNYFIALAFLRFWGYWLWFSVNPLEYADVSDVINYTLPYVIITFSSYLFWLLFWNKRSEKYVTKKVTKEMEKVKKKMHAIISTPEQDDTPEDLRRKLDGVANKYKKRWVIKEAIGFFVFLGIIIAIAIQVQSWSIFSIALIYPIALIAWSLNDKIYFLDSIINNESIRFSLLFIILCAPAVVFFLGVDSGYKVKYGDEFSYIEKENIPVSSLKRQNDSLKYIGKLGEHFILSSYDNEHIIVVNQSNFDPLILNHTK